MAQTGRWWPWTPYIYGHIKRRGANDGRNGIPNWESKQQPPFLRQIKHGLEGNCRIIAAKWQQADDRLKARWLAAKTVRKNRTVQAQHARGLRRNRCGACNGVCNVRPM